MPAPLTDVQPDLDPLLKGGGECGALMRAMDWAAHPLGPPPTWSPELRTVVGIALGSKQPILIVWGPEQTTLYNDGYARMCGNRHPASLGRPFRDLWFDIWEHVDPIITAAYAGISTSMDDIAFTMHRNGYPEETHFAFSYSPVRDGSGAVLGMFCACVETTEQVIAPRRRAKERAQMRHIFESALGAVAIVTGPDHVFTFANRDYQVLAGRSALVGQTVAEAIPEAVDQGFVALLDTVLETGEAYFGHGVEIELHRTPGRPPEKRLLDFIYHPVGGDDGRTEGIFVQAIDITERADAERQRDLLNHELAHRLKNQLALVQAVANVTLRSAADLPTAQMSLNRRIAVLSRAQEMVLTGTAEATTVGAIVDEVISLHDDTPDARFRVGGPEIAVGARSALALSLMLHELSTNAAKYGALSAERGSVGIVWRAEATPEGDRFVLEWEETGGPPVSPPTHSGSGTRLLNAGVSGARLSQVTLTYRASGVRCKICVDMDGLRS